MPSPPPARKKFVMAGLWTEACVLFPTLDMLREGYEIYIPADACGDLSPEAHNRSMDRLSQAGAVPMTSWQYVFELQQDWARTETYNGVMDILQRPFAVRDSGALLQMGAWANMPPRAGCVENRRSHLGQTGSGGETPMKIYVMSLAAGLLVGVVYSLINVRSPAPPFVALVGLLGILAGEQIIPVGKAMLGGHALACCLAAVADARSTLFGLLPGRHAEQADASR